MANLEVLKFRALVVRDPLQKKKRWKIDSHSANGINTSDGVATGQKEARRTRGSLGGLAVFCLVRNADAQCQHGVHLVHLQEREGRRCQELAFLRLCRQSLRSTASWRTLRELRVGLEHVGMVRHDRM